MADALGQISIAELKGIGPAQSQKLSRLNLYTLQDLDEYWAQQDTRKEGGLIRGGGFDAGKKYMKCVTATVTNVSVIIRQQEGSSSFYCIGSSEPFFRQAAFCLHV